MEELSVQIRLRQRVTTRPLQLDDRHHKVSSVALDVLREFVGVYGVCLATMAV